MLTLEALIQGFKFSMLRAPNMLNLEALIRAKG